MRMTADQKKEYGHEDGCITEPVFKAASKPKSRWKKKKGWNRAEKHEYIIRYVQPGKSSSSFSHMSVDQSPGYFNHPRIRSDTPRLVGPQEPERESTSGHSVTPEYEQQSRRQDASVLFDAVANASESLSASSTVDGSEPFDTVRSSFEAPDAPMEVEHQENDIQEDGAQEDDAQGNGAQENGFLENDAYNEPSDNQMEETSQDNNDYDGPRKVEGDGLALTANMEVQRTERETSSREVDIKEEDMVD